MLNQFSGRAQLVESSLNELLFALGFLVSDSVSAPLAEGSREQEGLGEQVAKNLVVLHNCREAFILGRGFASLLSAINDLVNQIEVYSDIIESRDIARLNDMRSLASRIFSGTKDALNNARVVLTGFEG